MIEKSKLVAAKEQANALDKLVRQVGGCEMILTGFSSTEKYPVLEMKINGVSLKDDMWLTPREQYELFGQVLKAEIEKLKAKATEAYNKA